MKIVKPDYYDAFQCVAGKCRHTCCAGWEIDIDEETLEKYRHMEGSLGEKLKRNIAEGEDPHFILGKEERCPFLNEENLCEIILEKGEEALCQICTDHPRFRNFWGKREEIGVGLCCEAAAELILGKEETVTFSGDCYSPGEFEDPLEEVIYKVRKRAFAILSDRSLPVEKRVELLLKENETVLPEMTDPALADYYLSLERLEEDWTKVLEVLKENRMETKDVSGLELPFEQFLMYLTYRQLPQAVSLSDLKARIGYVCQNYRLLRRICVTGASKKACSPTEFMELARLWSSEIEYSPENTDEILDRIWEENTDPEI